MRTAKVTLDGKEHEVHELRRKANRAWRDELEKHFTELATALAGAPDTDVTDGQALATLVQSVSGKLIHSVDIVAELVQQYDPTLPVDDAYDSEVMDAFTAILGLAYPFGSAISRIVTSFGEMKTTTSQS